MNPLYRGAKCVILNNYLQLHSPDYLQQPSGLFG